MTYYTLAFLCRPFHTWTKLCKCEGVEQSAVEGWLITAVTPASLGWRVRRDARRRQPNVEFDVWNNDSKSDSHEFVFFLIQCVFKWLVIWFVSFFRKIQLPMSFFARSYKISVLGLSCLWRELFCLFLRLLSLLCFFLNDFLRGIGIIGSCISVTLIICCCFVINRFHGNLSVIKYYCYITLDTDWLAIFNPDLMVKT